MSILSSLYHGEIHDKPNDVHNVPQAVHAGTGADGAHGAAGNSPGGAQTASDAAPGAAQPAFGGARNNARQGGGESSWMGISFADESAMDAQLADAHAVALSDAFDRSDAALRHTPKSTGGSAAHRGTPESTDGSAALRHTPKSSGGSAAYRGTPESTDGNAVLPRHAERRVQALQEGGLRPPLYYTAQEQTPCASGVWESAHTVASKLESKEEFPQG